MNWQTVRLGDIADFLSGGTPSMKKLEYWGGNIPWVSAKDLKGSRINDSILHLTEEGALNGTKLVPENTILCVVRGMSLANEFRISISNVPTTFNQDLKAICPYKGVDPIFLFYTLFARRDHIKQLAGEASHGTKKLPTEVLQSVEIKLPDLSAQQQIASIASSYDDLIENNRRRIQLLEQSARLLYKEWFVHLRFPGHEHVKIKNGVPEGWEEKAVADLCSYLNRGITPKYNDSAVGVVVNQKCIRDRLINLELARRQSKEVPQKKLLRFGDVLVNSTGEGTLGRIAQVTFDVDNCTVDSHITIVRPADDVPVYYFGLFLTGLESFLSTMGRGATNQTELARSTIGEIRILLPPAALSEKFEDIVSPAYQLINRTVLQNKKLAEARDLLLPRLMNGEIEV
jgi:type I restriction enzyme, S subunit